MQVFIANKKNMKMREQGCLLDYYLLHLKSGSSLGMAHSAILADVSDMERDILQMLHVNNLI